MKVLTCIAVYAFAAALAAAGQGVSEDDVTRGYVRSRTDTGESYDFSAPEFAVCPTNMLLRGGATAYVRIHLSRWAFPYGESEYRDLVVTGDGTLWLSGTAVVDSYLGALGVVPRDGWSALPESCESACLPLGISGPERVSVMWYAEYKDSLRITWHNALLGRNLSRPVSYQLELGRNGDVTARFDLSRVPPGDPAFLRLWQAFGVTRPTTVMSRRVTVADISGPDPDGDGIPTYREVTELYTDPRSSDTDGDSLQDNAELVYGTSPRDYDTDGDGYGDATDPDPRRVTSWDDADGDGFPDAWVARWFGGVSPDPYADKGGDGVGNLASLYIGVRPDMTMALGTRVTYARLPSNVAAYKFAPSAFSFARPDRLTNLVSRAFRVDRSSPWQQLFVTSDLGTHAGWSASDVVMRWEAGKESGLIPLEAWDSFRIPVSWSNISATVRLTIDAAGPAPRLDRPLFLETWIPAMHFDTSYNVVLSGTAKRPVYLVSNDDGGTYCILCTPILSGYPHVGGIDDAVWDALRMPFLPGLMEFQGEFGVGGRLVISNTGDYGLPRQGSQPFVLFRVYHRNWWGR